MMGVNRSNPDQYQLRFPPGLRDDLKWAADINGRSLNAEIIARLEASQKLWPRINLPAELFERVRKTSAEKRADLEREINKLAAQAVDRALPTAGALHRDLVHNFHKLVETAPKDQQAGLRAEFSDLWDKLAKLTTSGVPK